MSKVVGWMERHRRSWWFAALLNAVLLTVLLLLLNPLFETNDDTTIYELTGGAKGAFDSHLIFINILIGKFLHGLYRILPGLQWYSLLQYAVLFFSFTALAYVLLNRMKTGMAAVVFGTLWFYFAYEGYIILQFSKTAGIAACAGIFLMFYALEREKRVTLPLVLGMLLALLGGMYRYKEFLLCAALMSGIGVYTLFTLNWRRSRELYQTIAVYVGSFAALFLLFAGLKVYDAHSYAKDEAWGSYIEFNDMRSNLLDYGFPDYETNREVYESLGISKEDLDLFRSCNYADPELFDREAIETLTALCRRRAIDRGFVREFFDIFPIGFFKIYVFTCFLLICGYWLFFGKKGRAELAALCYEAAVVGAAYAYLFYMGRYLVSRTETALWLAAALLVVWLLDEQREFFTARTAAAFCMCALVFNMKTWKDQFRFSYAQEKLQAGTKAEREFQQMVGEDKAHLYLAKLGTLSTFVAYGPFDPIPQESTANICKLGGWEYGCMTNDSVLVDFGIENPYRDLIDHPQVLVVDDKVKTTLNYLRAHYSEAVEADLVKTAGGRRFYAFRSKPLMVDTTGSRPADDAVVFSAGLDWTKKKVILSGELYRKGTDSFAQRVYLKLTDTKTKEDRYYNVMTQLSEGKTDRWDGLYGSYELELPLKGLELTKETLQSGRYSMELILETEDGMASVRVDEVLPHSGE